MNVQKDLFYAQSHEWVKYLDGGRALVGISDHAQSEMGDVAFINLCDEGDALNAGDCLGDIESIKAVSDVYSPVAGTVARVNDELLDDPARLNADPYGAWLIELEDVTENAELMDADAYENYISE
ncbi:MAG: glycine cleavage system protein GcvH [Oscillospiraceae bacterium]|nr:glycine cleavage system protein GcvH [Oscillospiraceae bacterium]